MSFVIAVIQAIVVMALAPLVSGMARVIRAKMHTRKGPSIFQDYYDIAKLFKRQDVHPKDSSFIHRITPAVYLGVMLLLAMGIPMFTAWSPVPLLGDIILIIYLMALARFFFALASMDTSDAYAGVGGLRELMVGILVEPTMILALFVTAICIGSTNVGIMGQAISLGAVSAPIAVVIAGVAFAFACYVELGKLPYDAAEAEQEIQEGLLQEYSGPSLAMMHIAMPMKQVIVASWFAGIFLPFGSAMTMSVGGIVLGIVFYLLKMLVIFLVCSVIENLVSRVRFKLLGRQTWAMFGISVFALVFCLMGL
jgi:hydrogenase-4 component C